MATIQKSLIGNLTKLGAGLALAACLIVSPASASEVYVLGTCFSGITANGSGGGTCQSAAAAGVGANTINVEYVVYQSTFNSTTAATVSDSTIFTFTGSQTLSFAGDTQSVSGTFNGPSGNPTCLNSTYTGGQLVTGTSGTIVIPAGCEDPASGTLGSGTVTVSYTNTVTNGTQTTGLADIVYGYNVTTGTPEPATMGLLGFGMIGAALFGRKRRSAQSK